MSARSPPEENETMMRLKGCPHCTGDVYEERDRYGTYTACLQCGHHLTEAEEVVLHLGGWFPAEDDRPAASAETATREEEKVIVLQ